MNTQSLIRRVRLYLLFFIIGLVSAGLTASLIEWEFKIARHLAPLLSTFPVVAIWIEFAGQGWIEVFQQYPFVAHSMDWLAFAHIVIAIAFIGPLKDPVRNKWVIEFGMIACILVLPVAIISGTIHGMPLFRQLMNCLIGLLGFLLLWLCRRNVLQLELLEKK